ncbi:MAG: sulfotransferase [Cyanobacteria bacterium P01_H01_bin.58]
MSQPRLLHPLMGVNPRTLLSLIAQNGTGQYPLHLGLITATAFFRWPFSAYERWQVERTEMAAASNRPPLFILGHWRSGTTFLYNILSRSPQFAYMAPLATGLPWDFLTLGNLLRPVLEKALPKGRFIDQVPVNPDSPQEDEIALASMQTVSFYHGLYFPKHFSKNFNAGIFFEGCTAAEIDTWCWTMQHLCKKLQIQYPEQQLLIKNPVYTARVKLLKQLFPNAKFVHIYRNPYVVFQSTLNFYKKLLKELALQGFDQVPYRQIVLESYPKMMQALLEDTASLAGTDFIEIRFEEFETDPLKYLRQIYSQLSLAGWETAEPYFSAYLSSQKNYQKNRYAFPQEDIQQVAAHWHTFLERWDYQPPA